MLKSIFMAAALLVATNANAAERKTVESKTASSIATASLNSFAGIPLTVGDTADYKLSGGIINGTMHAQVREQTPEGFWIQQDMDLGFLGKQKVEILIDPNTGQTKELLVNGEKQTPPDPSNYTVVEMKEANITVPAGTFDCVYVKMHDNKENKDSDNWINPSVVPVSGMIKTIAPGPMGNITVELTKFYKQ